MRYSNKGEEDDEFMDDDMLFQKRPVFIIDDSKYKTS